MSTENIGHGLASPLLCSTIAYRAMLKRSWVDQETLEVSSAAYIPRATGDEDGLSVAIRCTPEESVVKFKKHFGTASLHVGRVRDVNGLDIIEDPEDYHHGLITGLRIPPAGLARTEFLAGALAKRSRYIPVADDRQQ